ncbi:MAG: response regulator [Candidatus Zixiibacteriota bacterium]|nr:MAG: response regulator [candidate division Zixibacteria bacterium]
MTPRAEFIVVIDDEERMCDSLRTLLTGNGYNVEAFQTPIDALEVIKERKVDLVISDIKMPRMNGLEILREVKRIDEGIPVILMTGYAALDSALEAIAEGAYDYLLKPVEFTHLELVVSRAIDKRKAELARLQLMEELKLSNLILQRRIGELNALYEAGKSIGSSANLSELLRQIVVLASSVTEAKTGSIMLLNEARKYLTIEAAIGLEDEIVRTTRLPIGASIAGYVAKTGEALIVKDVEHDARFKRINRERYGAASLLCTPLKIKNDILGVINMAHKEGGGVFSDDDLRLLSTFASQAAVAVDDAYQFEKNRRRLAEFEVLHEIQSESHSISSLTAFRRVLVEKLQKVFEVDYAIWFDIDPTTGRLMADSALGDTDMPLTDSGRINLSKMEQIDIILKGFDPGTINLSDSKQLTDLVVASLRKNANYPKPRHAYMAVPIFRRGELAHIFYLGANCERPYSEDDYSLARLVISQAAVLFERERALLNATRLLTMGNMISEISHDLRKPLTSIRGSLQIFKERWPDIAGQSELFGTAEEEVHRMNDMVRELVDFSNPNKYETSKEDLQRIVSRAAELVKPEMTKNQVSFRSEFANVNWEVILNKNQILEVFLNLFLNAIESMPDGGTLTVTGRVKKPPHRDEQYLSVSVKDSGPGIAKENQARIFERYYTTKETGTGLGLVVVERIISAHSGTLHVKSGVGKGTELTVYLPRPN